MENYNKEKTETTSRKNETYAMKGDKVKVTGVGYERPDGSGTQTTYKTNYEVTFLEKVEGKEYPYLVEYHGNKRYFKKISEK